MNADNMGKTCLAYSLAQEEHLNTGLLLLLTATPIITPVTIHGNINVGLVDLFTIISF